MDDDIQRRFDEIFRPKIKPGPVKRDEYGYPLDWPKCPGCGLPALDGHVTCGDVQCREPDDLP